MGDLFVLEGPDDVVDGIYFADVAEEMVAESLALGSALDDSSDVHDLQDCGDLGLGLVHFAELTETVIGYRHHCLVGIDGAEGVVFCRYVQVGQHIVGGGLAHVGQSHDAHAESVCGSAPEDLLLLSVLLLLGRHVVAIKNMII